LTDPARRVYAMRAAGERRPPRLKMNSPVSKAYRYYYYYGSLSARRDGAAMGCRGATMN